MNEHNANATKNEKTMGTSEQMTQQIQNSTYEFDHLPSGTAAHACQHTAYVGRLASGDERQ